MLQWCADCLDHVRHGYVHLNVQLGRLLCLSQILKSNHRLAISLPPGRNYSVLLLMHDASKINGFRILGENVFFILFTSFFL